MVSGRGRGGRPKKQTRGAWREIGLRLATIRLALDYKDQTAFAKRANLSQNRYNQYETGARPITLDAALKLKKAFDISLDYIYTGDRRGLPQGLLSALLADRETLKAS